MEIYTNTSSSTSKTIAISCLFLQKLRFVYTQLVVYIVMNRVKYIIH